MGNATLRIVGGIIGCMIAFVMFPMVLTGADEIQIDDQTDVLSSTTAGVTTDDVTLTEPLYDDDVTNVTSITSDNGSDAPTADSYATATRVLTVGGLEATGTRSLTILYEADATDGYTGLGSMVKFGPLIIFMGIILAAVGSLWSGVQSMRSRY